MREPWKIYQDFARDFDRDRNRLLIERRFLESLIEPKIASKSAPLCRVLDLGCGAGEPIARFFIDAGCAMTGVDAAKAMIEICEQRFPEQQWIQADMRGLALRRRFDAVIAWDSFFHLTAADQRSMFPVFSAHASPGARLLFSAGDRAGEAIGDLYGEPLHHASLDPAEYRKLLGEHGFQVLEYRERDPECGDRTIWLAERAATS